MAPLLMPAGWAGWASLDARFNFHGALLSEFELNLKSCSQYRGYDLTTLRCGHTATHAASVRASLDVRLDFHFVFSLLFRKRFGLSGLHVVLLPLQSAAGATRASLDVRLNFHRALLIQSF